MSRRRSPRARIAPRTSRSTASRSRTTRRAATASALDRAAPGRPRAIAITVKGDARRHLRAADGRRARPRVHDVAGALRSVPRRGDRPAGARSALRDPAVGRPRAARSRRCASSCTASSRATTSRTRTSSRARATPPGTLRVRPARIGVGRRGTASRRASICGPRCRAAGNGHVIAIATRAALRMASIHGLVASCRARWRGSRSASSASSAASTAIRSTRGSATSRRRASSRRSPTRRASIVSRRSHGGCESATASDHRRRGPRDAAAAAAAPAAAADRARAGARDRHAARGARPRPTPRSSRCPATVAAPCASATRCGT